MKVLIDGTEYDVPQEEEIILLKRIQTMMLTEYEKLDGKWRLMGKPVSREVLRQMETKARAKHGNDKALLFRPDKREDPTIHLSNIMLSILQEAMKHVTLRISTESSNEHNTIANFGISVTNKSEGGGQVAIDGNFGVRQNNGTQVS
jgi:hypothetical protein